MSGVYILENTINGKSYVGQTVNTFDRRFKEHRWGDISIISSAIKKYGWDNFKSYQYYIPENLLNFFEIEMIKKTNSLVPNGYNLEIGGKGGRPSKESKIKMSEAHKGVKLSEEHKRKIGLSQIGRIGPMVGKTHSKESKKKTSEALKGIKRSVETKKKMSIVQKGRVVSKEARKNISEAGKGRIPWNKGLKGVQKISEETKKKLSEAAKRQWAKQKELV